MIDAFTEHILGFDKDKGGIFGHSSGYYGMIEEQGTGMLHCHMLVWLHGFNMAEMQSNLEDNTFKQDLLEYLESITRLN